MSFLSTKKGKLYIWAVILLIIAGLVIYAWNTPPTEVSNLLLKRIEWDYDRRVRDEIVLPWDIDAQVEKCYGIYDGCVAVMVSDGLTGNFEWKETVAGHTIHYSNGNSIVIYKKGEFFDLEEAYSLGILAEQEIAKIAQMQNEKFFSD